MIFQAKESDLVAVLHVLKSCATWLADQGMYNWQNAIKKEEILQTIRAGEFFVFLENKKIIGTIAIMHEYSEHALGIWKDSNFFYLRKLAVLPSHHNQGIASKLMEFAEDKARKEKHCIRFDCLSKNKKLNDFYVKRGYKFIKSGPLGINDTVVNFYEKRL